MNLENFERVKAAILANPETLNMQTWGSQDSDSPCGTVGCLAGFCDWLMAVDGRKHTLFAKSGKLNRCFSEDAEPLVIGNAREFLGITDPQSRILFFTWEWPSRFAEDYDYTDSPSQRAAVLVRRIDHFIATGE